MVSYVVVASIQVVIYVTSSERWSDGGEGVLTVCKDISWLKKIQVIHNW